jgi:hypothetical protein
MTFFHALALSLVALSFFIIPSMDLGKILLKVNRHLANLFKVYLV